jgi:hypothetical protein
MQKTYSNWLKSEAAVAAGLVIVVSLLGILTSGQKYSTAEKKAAAPMIAENVLPKLIILPESLEPNLSGCFATGDGGGSI